MVRALAAATGASLTETIRLACSKALAEASSAAERDRRLAAMQAVVEELRTFPDTGVVLDKAFFDALNDD